MDTLTKQDKKLKPKAKITDIIEKIVEAFLFLCASMAVLSVVVISVYIFIKGTPAIAKIGPLKFIFGMVWNPSADLYGIFPMIVGSIYLTLGAIIVGVPIGLLTAVFLAELAPKWLTKIITPAVELLAGIPSVVYGFFGLIVIVPIIDKIFGGGGNSLLAAIIILSIMILPTIINISQTSIKAVPSIYKEGSLALGASNIETIFKVIIPAAKSGILASVVLAVGRAIGETMAVILVAGNTPMIPEGVTSSFRTLTANIAMEMSYASGLQLEALFATGVVLFVFIMVLNLTLNLLTYKAGE